MESMAAAGFSGFVGKPENEKQMRYNDVIPCGEPRGKRKRFVSLDFRCQDDGINMSIVHKIIEQFKKSDMDQLFFPPTSRTIRCGIHDMAKKENLRTKSFRSEPERYSAVYKVMSKVEYTALAQSANPLSRYNLSIYARIFMDYAPVTTLIGLDTLKVAKQWTSNKWCQKSMRLLTSEEYNKSVARTKKSLQYFRLSNDQPKVAPTANPHVNSKITKQRADLPAMAQKEDILKEINANRVTLITGDTGCGKTTQVGQFLLEQSAATSQLVRVVCTQPRRIAATAVADRVAAERGERLGTTVGYHIRHYKKTSENTLLTFCTAGVLLRTLGAADNRNHHDVDRWTHIILDEAHERESVTDFLLCALRLAICNTSSNVKIIIMSATLESQISLFTEYLGQVGIGRIHIDSKMYDVKELYLEHCLHLTGFRKKYVESPWEDDSDEARSRKAKESAREIELDKEMKDIFMPINAEERGSLHPDAAAYLKLSGLTESDPISKMSAAKSADNSAVSGSELPQEFSYDSSAPSTSSTGESQSAPCLDHTALPQSVESNLVNFHFPDETDPVLKDYYAKNYDVNDMDYELVTALVVSICERSPEGAILVFLPGFEEIMKVKKLLDDTLSGNQEGARFRIFVLHSQVSNDDQKEVFKPLRGGLRKIILSTNIAEASVTIDDIKFVVDTGKMKEKNYHVVGGYFSLRTIWTSKTNATQRKGRAGRTSDGVVFRCYSELKYKHYMPECQRAEILRGPLHEICLNCKSLAPGKCSIADFLKLCPEQPDPEVIDKTLDYLKAIEALDESEELTNLGHRLLDLPLPPQLGKVLLHGITMKCIDPCIFIVAILSNRDPFNLVPEKKERKKLDKLKKELAASDFSEHRALLELCCKYLYTTDKVCETYKLNKPTMEMMDKTRCQFYDILIRQGLIDKDRWADVNINSTSLSMIKAALVAGLYPNVAVCNSESKRMISGLEPSVHLHKSVMFGQDLKNLPSPFLIYNEMCEDGGGFSVKIRGVTCVSPVAIALFCGASKLSKQIINLATSTDGYDSDGNGVLVLGTHIAVKLDGMTSNEIIGLRQQYQAVFLEKMMVPKIAHNVDSRVIDVLRQIAEEADGALLLPVRGPYEKRIVTASMDSAACEKKDPTRPMESDDTEDETVKHDWQEIDSEEEKKDCTMENYHSEDGAVQHEMQEGFGGWWLALLAQWARRGKDADNAVDSTSTPTSLGVVPWNLDWDVQRDEQGVELGRPVVVRASSPFGPSSPLGPRPRHGPAPSQAAVTESQAALSAASLARRDSTGHESSLDLDAEKYEPDEAWKVAIMKKIKEKFIEDFQEGHSTHFNAAHLFGRPEYLRLERLNVNGELEYLSFSYEDLRVWKVTRGFITQGQTYFNYLGYPDKQ